MLFRVHLPLLRPALGAAALLVFVDSMKELPATLLLRPFNFDTLSTQVFTLVSLYRYEEGGAVGAYHRSGQPRADAAPPRDHRGQPANRLGRPFARVRSARRIGVAYLLITQENAGVGLAIGDQSG
jgi:hypothetical protein